MLAEDQAKKDAKEAEEARINAEAEAANLGKIAAEKA